YAANNNSYSDVRGLELTLSKNYGDWIQGFVNYTYQEVSLGQFGQTFVDDNPVEELGMELNPPSNSLYYLASQKPIAQPRANASITFLTPKDFGLDILGTKLLGEWSINLIGTWKAGPWISWNPNNVGGVTYNVQETDISSVDLRINKTFSFGNTFSLTLFVEATNLLNEKRLSGESFDSYNDYEAYMNSLHLPSSNAYTNVPGSDRVGDYRMDGVAYVPVLYSGDVTGMNPSASGFDANAIYWSASGKYANEYMQYSTSSGTWRVVTPSTAVTAPTGQKYSFKQVLDDKAYIDMPNESAFDFLNPRQFYFGINLSF
ncbi:MAG TPA: hypothetical protein VEG28_04655, partial [Dehalococcoidia bacterium]|nr:hypothetical protein [Dehalococcoidia bacterium]